MTPEETVLQLQAEADLLREELEGLYAEKDQSDSYIKVLLASADHVEDEARKSEQDRAEMELAIRQVNDLYGPFTEFEPWCQRVRA